MGQGFSLGPTGQKGKDSPFYSESISTSPSWMRTLLWICLQSEKHVVCAERKVGAPAVHAHWRLPLETLTYSGSWRILGKCASSELSPFGTWIKPMEGSLSRCWPSDMTKLCQLLTLREGLAKSQTRRKSQGTDSITHWWKSGVLRGVSLCASASVSLPINAQPFPFHRLDGPNEMEKGRCHAPWSLTQQMLVTVLLEGPEKVGVCGGWGRGGWYLPARLTGTRTASGFCFFTGEPCYSPIKPTGSLQPGLFPARFTIQPSLSAAQSQLRAFWPDGEG